MAPTTRTPSKGRGQAPPGSLPADDDFGDFQSSPGGDQQTGAQDLQSNLLALQQAQVMTQIKTQQQDKQLSDIQKTLTGIMTLLQTPPAPGAPGPSETVLPSREFSQPIDNSRTGPTTTAPLRASERPSVAPSGLSQSNYNYKPRKKDPPNFDNNDGEIQYKPWKEQILDKFEEDAPQFTSARSYMSYLFNCTKGDAQKHLYPRYTRDKRNQNPFTSYEGMLDTLDSIYLNAFEERDSRSAYRELKMTNRQSFQDFQTQFLHLANAGRIPEIDRFDDIYDKMTTALQDKLLIHRQLMNGDFNMLCTMAIGADSELKRLNVRRTQERKEREERLSKTPVSRPENRYPQSRPDNAVQKPASAGFSLLQRPSPAPPNRAQTQTQGAKLLELKCYNCFEPGHLSRDCPKPKRAIVNDIEGDEYADVQEDIDLEDQGKEDA
jgi:hypothetical protein